MSRNIKMLSEYIENNTLIGIKSGINRKLFTDIWMVTVAGRFFSRSWNKSKTGWFNEILKNGAGQLKINNTILNITVKKIEKDDAIHQKIDLAYLSKYTQPENISYAHGISQPDYHDFTVEFLIE